MLGHPVMLSELHRSIRVDISSKQFKGRYKHLYLDTLNLANHTNIGLRMHFLQYLYLYILGGLCLTKITPDPMLYIFTSAHS